jgi:hypothetical protein
VTWRPARAVAARTPWPAAGAADRPFACLAAAFALALVAHQLWWRGLPGADLDGLVCALAAWVLARPAAPGRLLALAVAELAAVAGDLPAIGDHTLLAVVTAAAFAASFAGPAVRGRRLPTPSALWPALAPFLRLQAVLLYGAAALAKLNAAFLDPERSCAGPLAAQLAFFDPSLLQARWVAAGAIVATVIVEAALALLLLVRRTRVAAVVLGAGFHAALALAGNVPFAAYALVLYVAFLPPAALPAWRLPLRGMAVAAGALLLAGWAAGPEAVGELLRPALRVGVAAGLVAMAVAVARARTPALPRAGLRALGPAYAAALLLLAANALSPYAGLRTEATFTMFSNLQTEPGHWNHLLVPEAVRVLGAQDDLVRLVASDAPGLERRRRAGALMVRAELERFLRRTPGARATYVPVGGSRPVTASAATLGPRPLHDRIMNFSDVRPGGRGRC